MSTTEERDKLLNEHASQSSTTMDPTLAGLPFDPKHTGKHIDPATGIWPTAEWGYECQRGFVRDARFARSGAEKVIAGSSRDKSRQWRRLNNVVQLPK